MSTVYTPRQLRFIYAFIHHIQPQLKAFLNIDSNDNGQGTSTSDLIDGVSTGVNTLSAAVAITGVAVAAPTMGTSLAGAAACIALLQTFNGGYQFVKRHTDNKNEPFSPDETKTDEVHLSLSILLRQVAYLAAVRYRHFIDEILEDNSVNTFASFVADRAMKNLATELAKHVDLTNTPSADAFLDYFMASARLSISHKPIQVVAKNEYSATGQCSSATIYAKHACSRAGLAVYDESSPSHYMLYVSSNESLFQRSHTTLQQHYGFATVPQSELGSNSAAVSRKDLKPLSPAIMEETLNKHKHHFSVFHQVTRQQVSDYLIEVREAISTNLPIKTLNQYLSDSLNTNVIAACDDNRLCGLDLSDGNFSETWFVGHADFSNCNLQNTIWKHALLNGAQFENNNLSKANFQYAYLENTIWQHINFSGDFSHAKLNGSKLTDCTISTVFNQFGCEWALVKMENIKSEDAFQLLNLRFDEQLTREHQERTKLDHEIGMLNDRYETCMNKNHDLSVKDEEELAVLHNRVQELETNYTQHLNQLDFGMADMKTQFLRIQKDQETRLEKQSEIIENMVNRINKLERGSLQVSSKYLGRLSIFYTGPQQQNPGSAPGETETVTVDEKRVGKATTPNTQCIG